MQMELNYFAGLTLFQSIYYNGKAPGAEFQYSNTVIDVAGDFI